MHTVLAFLLATQAVALAPFGVPVSGLGYSGLVRSCHATDASNGCWEPSTSDIATLENALHAAVRKRPPVGLLGLLRPPLEYVRQYSGFRIGTQRIIVVQGFHRDTPPIRSGEWQHAMIAVSGGGGLYFTGRFSSETGRFLELGPNGPK